MLTYALLLLVPSLAAVVSMPRRGTVLGLTSFFVILLLAVGLRHEVGMDWFNYVRIQDQLSLASFEDALMSNEPGFSLTAWASEQMGFGIYGTNFVAAAMFSAGLVTYASTTRNPWLALVAALPYLTTVVAMSASRQSAALGLLLIAFARWRTSSILTRVAFVIAAASFHLSALFCLGFILVEARLATAKKIALLACLLVVIGMTEFSQQHLTYYSTSYLDASESVHSPGALAHVLLIATPGLIYLLLRRKWERRLGPNPLLHSMSILSLAAVPTVFAFSTAVDRMSLYLYALPMALYAGAPYVLAPAARPRLALPYIALVVIAHFILLFGWLAFANHAEAYLPYENVLLSQ